MSARRLAPALLAAIASSASAQPGAIHRQPLQTADFPGNGLHSVMVRTTIDRGGVIAPHVHAGLELAFVASGEVEVTIAAAPARRVAAGQSFQVPPRTRHSVRNVGSHAATITSTYIVDPAAPLATPAP